jgi:hypothetical protein
MFVYTILILCKRSKSFNKRSREEWNVKRTAGKMIGAIATNRGMSGLEERRPVESDKQIVKF